MANTEKQFPRKICKGVKFSFPGHIRDKTHYLGAALNYRSQKKNHRVITFDFKVENNMWEVLTPNDYHAHLEKRIK